MDVGVDRRRPVARQQQQQPYKGRKAPWRDERLMRRRDTDRVTGYPLLQHLRPSLVIRGRGAG